MKRYRIERPKDFMHCTKCGEILDARNDKEIQRALDHIATCKGKKKGKKQ
jgi:Fe2+ or Zn2+ uptake regulation protein